MQIAVELAVQLVDSLGRLVVLQTGQVVLSGKASDLLDTELIRKAYLGETRSPDDPGVVAAPVA